MIQYFNNVIGDTVRFLDTPIRLNLALSASQNFLI